MLAHSRKQISGRVSWRRPIAGFMRKRIWRYDSQSLQREKIHEVVISLLMFAVATLTPLVASADMKEMPGGLWEIRTRMDIPGLPP